MSIDEQISSVEAAAPLQITVSQMEDRTLIVVAGELDDFTAPFLRQRLTEEIEDGAGDVVLDIGLLTFVDSSGLALFLTAHKALGAVGRKLVIFSPTRTARRLFQITQLTDFLNIEPPEHTHRRIVDQNELGPLT